MNEQSNCRKVCILGATFSTRNLGVSALAYSVLGKVFEHRPDAEVYILDYHKSDPDYSFQWNGKTVRVILLSFSKRIYERNHIARLILAAWLIRWIPSGKLRNRLLGRNPRLRQLSEFDLFTAISGGDSFSDIYGLKRFFYVSLGQVLAVLLGKKLVQLPQTYGPFRTGISRIIGKYILSRSARVYSRDYEGLEKAKSFLHEQDENGKVRFCYDVAFSLKPFPVEGKFEEFRKSWKTLIGFNISGLLYRDAKQNPFGLKSDYGEIVRALIEALSGIPDAGIMLIPHVYGTAETTESDLKACRLLYPELKARYGEKLFLLEEMYDQNTIKYIIGNCDFFAGSRMHSCIAALSQNIPAAGLAYSKKFRGVYQTIGMEQAVVDLRRLRPAEAADAVLQLFAWRQNLRELLETENSRIMETMDGEFRSILSIPSGVC